MSGQRNRRGRGRRTTGLPSEGVIFRGEGSFALLANDVVDVFVDSEKCVPEELAVDRAPRRDLEFYRCMGDTIREDLGRLVTGSVVG